MASRSAKTSTLRPKWTQEPLYGTSAWAAIESERTGKTVSGIAPSGDIVTYHSNEEWEELSKKRRKK